MEFSLSPLDPTTRGETTDVYDDGGFYYIIAELDGRSGSVSINSSEVINVSSTGMGRNFSATGIVFVGGLPPEVEIFSAL